MREVTAFGILEHITDEMDLVYRVMDYPHRLRICSASYQILKEFDTNERRTRAGELFYEHEGHEFIRAVDNNGIGFRLHYRIVMDESLADGGGYGAVVELDDEIEPGVHERADRAWAEHKAEVRANPRKFGSGG